MQQSHVIKLHVALKQNVSIAKFIFFEERRELDGRKKYFDEN